MNRQRSTALLAVAVLLAPAASAHAQTPKGGVGQASDSGFYVWVDGSFQSISLPTYGVGLVRAEHATGIAIGPLDTFNVRASGAGIDAAVGYTFRNGIFSPLWGSNVRLEFGASRIDADAGQNASGAFGTAAAQDAVAFQMLSGFVNSGLACFGTCGYATSLSTDYAATRLNARGASDFRLSGVTVSPSLEVFTGHARTDQSLTTLLKLNPSGPFLSSPLYQADTSLAWTDWGTRVGLHGKLDITPWLAFGLGGNIGFASRDVAFSGSDVQGAIGAGATSTISRNADTTAFLANVEASLTARSSSQLAIRAFAGLNFDSRVPGIAPATYAGSYAPAQQGTPAGITFSSETSYYTGISVTLSFGP